MLRLYDSRYSGNCWKVRILLSQLELPFERVTLDLAKGEAAEPAFRRKSRFARVPALELEDGRTLVESGAILLYLAEGTRFIPEDPFLRAEMLGWMFFEQADIQKPIAVPRVYHLRGMAAAMTDDIARCHKEGNAVLEKLEQWIAPRTWLVGEALHARRPRRFMLCVARPPGRLRHGALSGHPRLAGARRRAARLGAAAARRVARAAQPAASPDELAGSKIALIPRSPPGGPAVPPCDPAATGATGTPRRSDRAPRRWQSRCRWSRPRRSRRPAS